MKKHTFFINEHKRQEIKNCKTADIECCVVDIPSAKAKTRNYVIAEHMPTSAGCMFNGNFKYYFRQDCLKRFLLIY